MTWLEALVRLLIVSEVSDTSWTDLLVNGSIVVLGVT